jgi:hypothetical protein
MMFHSYLREHERSVRAFALKARVAHTTITRLLRGEATLKMATLSRIVAATDGRVSEQEVLASFGSEPANDRAAA